MAWTLSPATSPTPKDVSNPHAWLLGKGSSRRRNGFLQRSYSDNNLVYSANRARASMMEPKLKNSSSGFFNIHLPGAAQIPDSIKSFLFNVEPSNDNGDRLEEIEIGSGKKRANWVERVMELRSTWTEKPHKCGEVCVDEEMNGDSDGGCEVEYEDEADVKEVTVDREFFASLLRNVSWSDAKLFSQLSFLCNMAYSIEDIKTGDLKRCYGLDFVTSSLEKKAEAAVFREKLEQDSIRQPAVASLDITNDVLTSESEEDLELKPRLQPSAAYDIAVSAACYVQSHDKEFLTKECEQLTKHDKWPHEDGHQTEEDESSSSWIHKSELAACVAASTMTTVVAAGEKQKEKAAKDLQSLHSSPCEWFICDDLSIYTRRFVIQGSDSLASWQANLFFEPTKFEETDALVHRGIYEAAKGIYDQFLPEIEQHLNRFGDRAKFQLTGHSLGGSLALLVNLMLLTRKVIKPFSLLPVVTFGSPFVFCGGQKILDELNLDENQVHCVMMHRDIVPRAFSCNYPNYVTQVLKRLNNTFKFHPCLNKNKMLYMPMGKIFIIQPDEKSSPPHPLLPTGSALYALDNTNSTLTKSAFQAFLNSPHPLETLSEPMAYGSEGTIIRDHDSSNYLKAVNEIVSQHTRPVVYRASRHRNQLWPLITIRGPWIHEHDTGDRTEVIKKILTGV